MKGITIQEVQKLRNGDPSEEDLRDFFERREAFFRANKRIGDFIEYSPMPVPRAWTLVPSDDGDIVTRAEAKKIRERNKAAAAAAAEEAQ